MSVCAWVCLCTRRLLIDPTRLLKKSCVGGGCGEGDIAIISPVGICWRCTVGNKSSSTRSGFMSCTCVAKSFEGWGWPRPGHFFIFSIIKNEFLNIFYHVNLTGGGLFLKQDWRRNRLQGIGFKEIVTFYFEKPQKYRKCPALDRETDKGTEGARRESVAPWRIWCVIFHFAPVSFSFPLSPVTCTATHLTHLAIYIYIYICICYKVVCLAPQVNTISAWSESIWFQKKIPSSWFFFVLIFSPVICLDFTSRLPKTIKAKVQSSVKGRHNPKVRTEVN